MVLWMATLWGGLVNVCKLFGAS